MRIIFEFLTACIFAFILGFPFTALWNYSVVEAIYGCNVLTYQQGVCFVLLYIGTIRLTKAAWLGDGP